jgi:hypothetical protein
MSEGSSKRFSCDGCGKSYNWKPELSNKKVKCKCGAVMTAPDLSAPAEPEDDFSYEILETPKSIPVAKPRQTVVRTPMTSDTDASGTLNYDRGPSAREKKLASMETYIDKKRDITYPSIFLGAALLATIAWIIYQIGSDVGNVGILTGVMLAKTAIKTVVFVGLAIVLAPAMGLSFGGLWTAVFKLAAIVLFADALMLWVDVGIEAAMGGTNLTGRAFLMAGFVKLLLVAALIGFQLSVLFDMETEELGMIAFPMAFVNRLLDYVIVFALIAAFSLN